MVPGASRDVFVGPLGDRLKVRVRQAPEGGKANEAILRLLAERLGVPVRDLELVAGTTRPLKTVAILGLPLSDVGRLLYDEGG